jgi:hypothetical protein
MFLKPKLKIIGSAPFMPNLFSHSKSQSQPRFKKIAKQTTSFHGKSCSITFPEEWISGRLVSVLQFTKILKVGTTKNRWVLNLANFFPAS